MKEHSCGGPRQMPVPFPALLPPFQDQGRTDRAVLESIRRTELDTLRAIAISRQGIEDTCKFLAQMACLAR